jgi:hypothetical protein
MLRGLSVLIMAQICHELRSNKSFILCVEFFIGNYFLEPFFSSLSDLITELPLSCLIS